MSDRFEFVLRSIAIGAGATATMDLWAAALRRLGVPSLDFALLDGFLPSGRPVMVLDQAPASKPLDLSSVARRVLDPLAWGPGPASSSSETTGEW